MPYIQNALIFITSALLGLVIYVILLRFWMQRFRANFRNELGQFIISTTNPIVVPLRRILPPIGTIDTATILLAYLAALIKVAAVLQIAGHKVSLVYYFIWAFGLLLKSTIYLFLAAIFISIIASWIAPQSYHPILTVVRGISEPLLRPARKYIPPIAQFDLSPIFVILGLQLAMILLVAPILPNIF